MEGVRVLEVAMYGFVPSAGAVLADWGADVVKVEHAVTGDPQRGLLQTGRYKVTGDPNPNFHHANRGKRSVGIDVSKPEGREVLLELAKQADVFLTNFLPGTRKRFGIDVDDIRAVNPKIIYARGSALGPRGAEADRGGYDMTAFWCRGTSAASLTPPNVPGLILPAPAYGDTISGTNLAGGIAAALFKRERTGEPSVVDVSLLGSGLWAMGHGIAVSLHLNEAWEAPPAGAAGAAEQPAVRPLPDRRRPLPVAGHAAAAEVLGRGLPRDRPARNWPTTRGSPRWRRWRSTASREMRDPPGGLRGASRSPSGPRSSARCPGRGRRCRTPCRRRPTRRSPPTSTSGRSASLKLVSSPVQFDETAPRLTPAPDFAAQTDEVLLELGLDWDRLIELKSAGAIT